MKTMRVIFVTFRLNFYFPYNFFDSQITFHGANKTNQLNA